MKRWPRRTCTPASTPGHLGDVLSMICGCLGNKVMVGVRWRSSDGVCGAGHTAGDASGSGLGTRLPRNADSFNTRLLIGLTFK